MAKKYALQCLHSTKLCLYFGHFTALTRKLRCIARALQSSRGWHRAECEWLAFSPKFNVKQHHRSVAGQLVRF